MNETATKTMMLVTSGWQGATTFRMIPMNSNDSYYAEVLYDPITKRLVLISKLEIDQYQMMNALDTDGYPIAKKNRKTKEDSPYREERKLLRNLYEYYIFKPEEQKEFIKATAINAETFNYDQYVDAPPFKIETAADSGIVDKNGVKMTIEKKD